MLSKLELHMSLKKCKYVGDSMICNLRYSITNLLNSYIHIQECIPTLLFKYENCVIMNRQKTHT